MLTIEHIKDVDDKYSDKIANEFAKFAVLHNLVNDYLPFTFIAEVDEQFAGIIRGYSSYNAAHISELIVLEEYRNKGVGRKLLESVEQYCKERNFQNLNCSTYGFQAPEFYKKYGFELEFTRVNKENIALSKHFFVKYL